MYVWYVSAEGRSKSANPDRYKQLHDRMNRYVTLILITVLCSAGSDAEAYKRRKDRYSTKKVKLKKVKTTKIAAAKYGDFIIYVDLGGYIEELRSWISSDYFASCSPEEQTKCRERMESVISLSDKQDTVNITDIIFNVDKMRNPNNLWNHDPYLAMEMKKGRAVVLNKSKGMLETRLILKKTFQRHSLFHSTGRGVYYLVDSETEVMRYHWADLM